VKEKITLKGGLNSVEIQNIEICSTTPLVRA